MQTLINAQNLLKIRENDNLVLIDAGDRFLTGRLAGAQHVHLEHDLSDIKSDLSLGGRHPLPSPAHFGAVLGRLGITPQSHVVVYDNKFGAFAATRFWWMLLAAGHENVQVLDGGMQAAVDAGYPFEQGKPPANKAAKPYPVVSWSLPLTDMQQVIQVAENPEWLVIDVREAERYRGETEPYDPVAGHIPGAINVPYTRNLDENGRFHTPQKLKSIYEDIIGHRPISKVIVHCGSGVTACHTLLAMALAKIGMPALYAGSFSEWCRNGNPVIGKLLD